MIRADMTILGSCVHGKRGKREFDATRIFEVQLTGASVIFLSLNGLRVKIDFVMSETDARTHDSEANFSNTFLF